MQLAIAIRAGLVAVAVFHLASMLMIVREMESASLQINVSVTKALLFLAVQSQLHVLLCLTVAAMASVCQIRRVYATKVTLDRLANIHCARQAAQIRDVASGRISVSAIEAGRASAATSHRVKNTIIAAVRKTEGQDTLLIASLINLVIGLGNGMCIEFDLCVCSANWTGPSCDVPHCPTNGLSQQCFGHGICVGPGLCSCDPGFSGDLCQEGIGTRKLCKESFYKLIAQVVYMKPRATALGLFSEISGLMNTNYGRTPCYSALH